MTPPSRTKRFVYGTIGGLGLFAGAAGIAAAATRQPSPTTPPAASAEAGDQKGTTDRNEGQDHSYTSSITVPETPGAPELSDADEAKQLQALAKISAADAEAAAVAAVPGKAAPAQLENEDGNVVWEVEVTAADGKVTEVKVDAGNGKVLHQEVEDADEHDGKDDHDKGSQDKDSQANETQDGGKEVQDQTTSSAPAN